MSKSISQILYEQEVENEEFDKDQVVPINYIEFNKLIKRVDNLCGLLDSIDLRVYRLESTTHQNELDICKTGDRMTQLQLELICD